MAGEAAVVDATDGRPALHVVGKPRENPADRHIGLYGCPAIRKDAIVIGGVRRKWRAKVHRTAANVKHDILCDVAVDIGLEVLQQGQHKFGVGHGSAEGRSHKVHKMAASKLEKDC